MPTYFCSAGGCGHRISYETTKPSSCPKCKTVFADMGKVLAKAAVIKVPVVKPKAPTIRYEEEVIEPVTSQALTASKRKMLERAEARRAAQLSNTVEGDSTEDGQEEDDLEEDLSSDSVPRGALHARMRDLAASITIRLEPHNGSENKLHGESVRWEDLTRNG